MALYLLGETVAESTWMNGNDSYQVESTVRLRPGTLRRDLHVGGPRRLVLQPLPARPVPAIGAAPDIGGGGGGNRTRVRWELSGRPPLVRPLQPTRQLLVAIKADGHVVLDLSLLSRFIDA